MKEAKTWKSISLFPWYHLLTKRDSPKLPVILNVFLFMNMLVFEIICADRGQCWISYVATHHFIFEVRSHTEPGALQLSWNFRHTLAHTALCIDSRNQAQVLIPASTPEYPPLKPYQQLLFYFLLCTQFLHSRMCCDSPIGYFLLLCPLSILWPYTNIFWYSCLFPFDILPCVFINIYFLLFCSFLLCLAILFYYFWIWIIASIFASNL